MLARSIVRHLASGRSNGVRFSSTAGAPQEHGYGKFPLSADLSQKLSVPLSAKEIKVKPDGQPFLPHYWFRSLLNATFGVGGWLIQPVSPLEVSAEQVMREFSLYAHGNLLATAYGDMPRHSAAQIGTLAESCRSNAIVRCCKDLGIARELWDDAYVEAWKRQYTIRVKNIPFRVIGVLEKKGTNMVGQDQDNIVLMPYSTVRKRLQGSEFDNVNAIMASARSAILMKDAQNEIDQLLGARLPCRAIYTLHEERKRDVFENGQMRKFQWCNLGPINLRIQ